MAIDSVLQAADRANCSFDEIPIMCVILPLTRVLLILADSDWIRSDMKDSQSTDTGVRQRLAREIRDACINVGFFYGS